ncbi:hypothetical protein ACOSP7_012104 [Xanthoceras sorbifolium]
MRAVGPPVRPQGGNKFKDESAENGRDKENFNPNPNVVRGAGDRGLSKPAPHVVDSSQEKEKFGSDMGCGAEFRRDHVVSVVVNGLVENKLIKSFSKGHVDSIVRDCEGSRWRFTGFYGEPNLAFRFHSWSLLRRLEGLFSLPWIIGGDFNEILKDDGKVSGRCRRFRAMADFRDAVNGCGLLDLGFKGSQFTWSNRQDGENFIHERLDVV